MVIIDYKSQISVIFLDIYLSSIHHRGGDFADSIAYIFDSLVLEEETKRNSGSSVGK